MEKEKKCVVQKLVGTWQSWPINTTTHTSIFDSYLDGQWTSRILSRVGSVVQSMQKHIRARCAEQCCACSCLVQTSCTPSFQVGILERMTYGGPKQQLQQLKEAEGPQAPSSLAAELLEKWSWGSMSAPLVQTLAAAAKKDGLDHPQIHALAGIGASGKFPGNMHRDLLQITGKPTLASSVSEVKVSLCVNEKCEQVPLTFLLPHKLFAALYHSLPHSFMSSLLGGKVENVASFWAAMKDHPNVLARPELRARPDLHQVIPIGIHGDGVSYMQPLRAGGKTMDVLSWTSLLCHGPTRVSTFLMIAIVKTV